MEVSDAVRFVGSVGLLVQFDGLTQCFIEFVHVVVVVVREFEFAWWTLAQTRQRNRVSVDYLRLFKVVLIRIIIYVLVITVTAAAF